MSTLNEIVTQLSVAARKIRQLESEAALALYDHDNKDQYHKLMVEKALTLLNLPETIAGLAITLDPKRAQSLKSQIGAFSFSAGKALDINSVFYMSALLYPCDYTDGDTNDLENVIVQLENSC